MADPYAEYLKSIVSAAALALIAFVLGACVGYVGGLEHTLTKALEGLAVDEQMTDDERFWIHCVDAPGLWLIAVKDGHIDSWDGPHDTPQEVAKALRLFRSLGLDRPGRRYWMVRFDEVPEHTGAINEKAVGIMRPLIDRYTKQQKGPSDG